MRAQKIEIIFDEAITRIQSGENIYSVISSFPDEHRDTLFDMLGIARQAVHIPLKEVPTPIKRRIYLDIPKQNLHLFKFLSFIKTAYPVSVLVLLATLTGTVCASMNCLPGDRLFTIKKALQGAEVMLVQNPERKAELQLNIAQKRLHDAQTVIAATADTQSQSKAIEELNKETDVALQKIKEIAASNPVNSKPELIKKAEEITESKQRLLSAAAPEVAKESAARVEEHKHAIASIKQIIAAANEQDQAKLEPTKEIAITSAIESIRNKLLKIEKNTFEVDEANTVIEDEKGNKLALKDLSENDMVKVEGQIKNQKTLAQKIVLISKAKLPEVKPTTKPTTGTATAARQAPPATLVVPEGATGETTIDQPPLETFPESATVPEEKPQDAYTGFIPEAPAE